MINKDRGNINKNCPRIIFLDVDGVLNCRTTIEKCGLYRGIEDLKVLLLKSIIDKTNAKIALISSWKENYYLKPENKNKQDELANYLDSKLERAGIKISYIVPDYLYCFSRADLISKFLYDYSLKKHNKINFIILDDENNGYSTNKKLNIHFIKTSFEDGGLLPIHVKKAIELLKID